MLRNKLVLVSLLLALALGACSPATPTPSAIPTAGEVGGGEVETETPTPFEPGERATATPTPYVYPTAMFTDSIPAPDPVPYIQNPNTVAFVLLGSDAMPHRSDMDRTDSIMLVLVNFDNGTVSLVSLPRDLYVLLPGYGMTRINSVWSLRGEQGLYEMLLYNFGIKMDAYAFTRIGVLRQYIDEVLQGVTVDVPEPVLDHCGDLVIDMLPGPHEMSGDVAVCYARVRSTSSDYPRMLRQQSLLVAIRDKALEAAGDDPFGFFVDSLRLASEFGLQTSVRFLDFAQLVWETITDPSMVTDDPVRYRLMPPFSTHFDHPVTGAWLLAPPDGACITALMDRAWLGMPWTDAVGGLIPPCEAPG